MIYTVAFAAGLFCGSAATLFMLMGIRKQEKHQARNEGHADGYIRGSLDGHTQGYALGVEYGQAHPKRDHGRFVKLT